MNITAFLNLMVILVPFLLITAVFSRLAILELSLPDPDQESVPLEEPAESLSVIIRHGGFTVTDKDSNLTPIPRVAGEYNLPALSDLMQDIKSRHPKDKAVTLLLEADIPYETLIQVMDTVRLVPAHAAESGQPEELFSDISIGDAPKNKMPTEEPSL